MTRPLRVILSFSLVVLINLTARAQFCLGAGYGTFHVGGASVPFRGWGPTLRMEYIDEDKVTSMYLDVSYFQKPLPGGTTQIYDNNGMPVGSATVTDKYSYIYNQIGFKHLLGADADERKFTAYLAAGAAVVFARQTFSYQSSVAVPDNTHSSVTGGFTFGAGIQYNIKPVILELRGNLDIVLKPLVDDNSNILTNLRLSAMVPILN